MHDDPAIIDSQKAYFSVVTSCITHRMTWTCFLWRIQHTLKITTPVLQFFLHEDSQRMYRLDLAEQLWRYQLPPLKYKYTCKIQHPGGVNQNVRIANSDL